MSEKSRLIFDKASIFSLLADTIAFVSLLRIDMLYNVVQAQIA